MATMASLRRQARFNPTNEQKPVKQTLTFGQQMSKCRELVKSGQAVNMKEAWAILKQNGSI